MNRMQRCGKCFCECGVTGIDPLRNGDQHLRIDLNVLGKPTR